MRISDWSSDVCSSDLLLRRDQLPVPGRFPRRAGFGATQGGARLILSLHLRRYLVLVLQCLGGLALVLLAAGIAIRLLYALPSLELRAASAHIPATGDTTLATGVARLSRHLRHRTALPQFTNGRD